MQSVTVFTIKVWSMNTIDEECKTIEEMIKIYCRGNKHKHTDRMCKQCGIMLEYSKDKLYKCKYADAKPTCRKCPVHCYSKEKRLMIKQIMRYSGPFMILYHPLLAFKYILKDFRRHRRYRQM